MLQFPCRLDDLESEELNKIEKLIGSTTRNGTIKKMINTYRRIHQDNIQKDAEIRKLVNEIKHIKSLIAQMHQLEKAEKEVEERSIRALKEATQAKERAIEAVRKIL